MAVHSYNVGEWSELYVLGTLLADACLNTTTKASGDPTITSTPIRLITNGSETTRELKYEVDPNTDAVRISENGSSTEIAISRNKLRALVGEFLIALKSSKSRPGAFPIPIAETIIDYLGSPIVKSPPSSKTDIILKLDNLVTGIPAELAFSIKSLLAGKPTLLNASRQTNFLFKLNGPEKEITKAKAALEIGTSIQEPLKEMAKSVELDFMYMDSTTFESNLKLIDSLMPEIVAEVLKRYFTTGLNTIKDIAESLETEKPIRPGNVSPPDQFYSYKIRELLLSTALGMVPSRPWTGILAVHGGQIIVEPNGEVVCYHMFNLDDFKEYLFVSTKLDTPKSEYGFGKIEKSGTAYTLKLNLQIRYR